VLRLLLVKEQAAAAAEAVPAAHKANLGYGSRLIEAINRYKLLSTAVCCSQLAATLCRSGAHLDGVAQCCCCCPLPAGEHDTGRVQQPDVLVQVDLLHALGHSWRAANLQE
jgi:hypothetical protein